MSIREVQVTFDCADPAALARFWCDVLGYRVQPPPSGFESWDKALDAWGVPPEEHNSRSAALPPEGETGPRIFFQRVPEGKTIKNRVHLDVRAAPGIEGEERMRALDAEATRLVGLGATWVCRVDPDGRIETGFVVMQDPEGNEFCLD
jgi:catechol 2,3-dioxygenase-like lactoylglutathione lyase family enzyme